MFDGPLPEYEPEIVRDLRAARALIKNGWCRHHYAQSARGWAVEPEDDDAVSFCMLGAMQRVCVNEAKRLAMADAVQSCLPEAVEIQDFNDDDATHWIHVLGVFDAAIRRMKARSAANWKRKLARRVKRVEEMANV